MAAIVLTGASGFIGRALAPALAAAGHSVRTPLRGDMPGLDDLDGWSRTLTGADAVIHAAARAHARPRPQERAAVLAVNRDWTITLGQAAARAGVPRFVFLSSVKAVGEAAAAPWTEAQAPRPATLYGEAKWQAEQGLAAIDGLSAVRLRPPLVIAADAKANFAALLRLAASPAPLPFAGAAGRRSLISRESLIAAILRVIAKPDGPAGAFFIADAPALTAGEMIAALRAGLGRGPGLFPAPLPRIGPLRSLLAAMAVDPGAFCTAYDWTPGDMRAALAAVAAAVRTRKNS